ncbi:sulfate ABC transporter substrate-binding protein [Methylocystis sp. S23]
MLNKLVLAAQPRQVARFALLAALALSPWPVSAGQSLLNVSYDPTRELYKAVNKSFAADWKKSTGEDVDLQTSHGGSGAQARSVIEGLSADIVTLALANDIDAIAAKTGKIPADWQKRLPNNSSPYTSTIVILVRKGNPKAIKDWDDLAKPGVAVIAPNPKTGGGARWNFLAAWAYGLKSYKGDEARTQDLVKAIYANVPVMDTGARGSTVTFAQRGIGDALITWENEAFLALAEFGADKFEIVTPSVSILAEPAVALVDGNADAKGTRKLAEAFLAYLFKPETQALVAKYGYRPAFPERAAKKDLARFARIELVTIDKTFGGWPEAQKKFFVDGGIFDQIQKK